MLTINGKQTEKIMSMAALKNKIGQRVKLQGSVYKVREMRGFSFVLLRMHREIVQCVYAPKDTNFDLKAINEQSWVVFTGEVVKEERAKTGFEVHLREAEVLSEPFAEPPVVINNKEVNASLDTLLDYRQLTLRNEKERAIFKIQEGLVAGIREFLLKERFTEIRSPKIVYAGAEGGSNIFEVPYFGKTAFLAQSPQFYKQMMVGVYERVFEIAPVFRAEKHDSSRHINEYTSVDLEMGFIENFYDICQMETGMLQFVFDYVQARYAEELHILRVKVPQIKEIPAIKFLEAKEWVEKEFNRPITDYNDFDPEEEKLLGQLIERETGSEFVFVTHYPAKKRPFYAMNTPEDNSLTDSFDLLFRGLEVTTGGQRVHDYKEQIAKMESLGMDITQFESYLMAHKYGLPPHGGLGLGLERLTAQLLGFQNIRRTTMFPRDIHRLTP